MLRRILLWKTEKRKTSKFLNEAFTKLYFFFVAEDKLLIRENLNYLKKEKKKETFDLERDRALFFEKYSVNCT